MCQEIYIANEEAIRPNRECWCPLQGDPDGKPDEAQNQAYRELGRMVWASLQKNHNKETDPSKVVIEVELKLW